MDRGGEYLDNELEDYLLEHGIVSQLTAPGTPQQNGVAERCWSVKKYFALPIKSEKQNVAEAWYRYLLKFFKTLLNL